MLIKEIFVEYMYWQCSAGQGRLGSVRPGGAFVLKGGDRKLKHNLLCDGIYKTPTPNLLMWFNQQR